MAFRVSPSAAFALFTLMAAPAMAQEAEGEVLLQETRPDIDISIIIDPRVHDHPGLFEMVKEDAEELAAESRQFAAEDHAERGSEASWLPHTLDAAYEVTFANDRVASVVSTRHTYSGGAHGNQDFVTFTLDRTTGERVGIDALLDSFAEDSVAFLSVQAYVRVRIGFERAERLGLGDLPPEDMDWVRDGTTAPEDLTQFTLYAEDGGSIASGIMLYFPPYQVGSYAEGSYVVEVPALVFAEHLAEAYRPLFDVNS